LHEGIYCEVKLHPKVDRKGRAVSDPVFRLIDISLHVIFYVLCLPIQAFLGAESVLAVEPEAFAPAFGTAEFLPRCSANSPG